VLRHRVNRVERQVEQDLFEIVRIDIQRQFTRLGRSLFSLDGDAVSLQLFTRQFENLVHDGVEIGALLFLGHRAVKVAHSPHDRGDAFCLFFHHAQVAPQLLLPRAAIHFLPAQLKSAYHGLERVIELVRNRADQPSQRRHFFGLDELCL